jgi:GNAT superfamily N-acetyltransferase
VALPRDVEALTRLLGELFRQEAEFNPEPRRQRRALRALLARGDEALVLVAERGPDAVGMVTLQALISTATGGSSAWLEDMVVTAAERGRGTGSALMKAAMTEARRRRWTRISLLTDADNSRAHKFYRKHAFAASPMRPFRRMI